MNSDIEKLCKTLLYEGYALFPYRKNALKNQKRFNFGVLSPKCWIENQINEHFFQQTEILVLAENESKLSFKTHFLRLNEEDQWQTAVEKKIEGEISLNRTQTFEHTEDNLFGKIEISSERLTGYLFKVRFFFENLTEIEDFRELSREQILHFSFVSTHTIFELENGKFISQIETPNEFIEHTNSLQNVGLFPVLIGDKYKKNNILASPIILYDFPEIAENSFDNFFDGLEIDELMILNLLVLPEDEKRQITETDERTRLILEKIENLKSEDLQNLHAVLR